MHAQPLKKDVSWNSQFPYLLEAGPFPTIQEAMKNVIDPIPMGNQAIHIFNNSPECYEKANNYLQNLGHNSFTPIGLGAFAVVLQINDDEVVRVTDAKREKPRRKLSEILQTLIPSITIESDNKKELLKVEILPKVINYQEMLISSPETAEIIFSEGRLNLIKSLVKKGFMIKHKDYDDSLRNFGITKEGKFVIIDGDSITELPESETRRENYQQYIKKLSKELKKLKKK